VKHAPRGPIKARPEAHPIELPNPMKAVQCKATNRQGRRCGKPAIRGGVVCRLHGGAAPQVKLAAMARLKAMQPKALDTLEALMDRDEFPTVQLQASKAVIDWTEGKAKESVQMEVSGDEALIAALLQGRKRAAEARG